MSKIVSLGKTKRGDDMKKETKESIKLFLKSAFFTALGLIIIAVGFVAAGYFFG